MSARPPGSPTSDHRTQVSGPSHSIYSCVAEHCARLIRIIREHANLQCLRLLSQRSSWDQANLARLNLPYPEAVFEISFFRENPKPCKTNVIGDFGSVQCSLSWHSVYQLAHELMPGRFRPTPTHSFVRLLSTHDWLHVCFTQNIDTLERRAGVPGELIVEAHGSFASQRCIECKTSFDDEKMREHIREKRIPTCKNCEGLVKPDIVFFGESVRNLLSRLCLLTLRTPNSCRHYSTSRFPSYAMQTCYSLSVPLSPSSHSHPLPEWFPRAVHVFWST